MDNFLAVKTAVKSGCGGHGLEQPSAIKKQHAHGNTANGLDKMLQLGNALHVKLQVKDENWETSSDSPSDDDGSSGLEDKNTINSDLIMDGPAKMASKCLHKCATFPVSVRLDQNEPEPQLEDYKGCSRSLSMPTVRKLVSAMKGGREKEGVPQKKLSVSWASDVYDPPPTSVSHFPKKKNQQHYSKSHKKHGKGKQKGKNTRGGASGQKERKHHRKTGRRPDPCLDSYPDPDRIQNYKSSLELLDFNDPGIASTDPNCGSKFLGQPSGTMHCVY